MGGIPIVGGYLGSKLA